MYEQILIDALEMITRKAHFKPAMDDPLGQLPFTTDRCVDIAERALTFYKIMINKEKERKPMASDKELRALADRIGTFFDEGLPEMMTRLMNIEMVLSAQMGIVPNKARYPIGTEPEYHGDIEPSKGFDPETDKTDYDSTSSLGGGLERSTDVGEALRKSEEEEPPKVPPIDVFKTEEDAGGAPEENEPGSGEEKTNDSDVESGDPTTQGIIDEGKTDETDKS